MKKVRDFIFGAVICSVFVAEMVFITLCYLTGLAPMQVLGIIF